MAGFVGKWKLVDSENFEEYMKAIGVGMIKRKMANSAKPNQEITLDGDQVTIKTLTPIQNFEMKFKFGEEFTETTPDGSDVKSIVTKESDNKLVQVQKGEIERTITREIVNNEYIMTMEAKGVIAKRRYQRNE